MKEYRATYHDREGGTISTDGVSDIGLTLHGKESTLHFTILNWSSFNDFGQTLETVLVVGLDGKDREIYSQDEGKTFTLELHEPVH